MADPDVDQRTTERNQNIEAVVEFYTREEQKVGRSQRLLERISCFVGQPLFLGLILLFVVLWIAGNLWLRHLGRTGFDPAPFPRLQGIIGLGALLTATVVLTRQGRLAGLEAQRAHLDLKVTLLTEQKTAKLIHLLEELRRDLPNVRDRHDPEATALQQPMNPDRVLAALGEHGALREPPVTGGTQLASSSTDCGDRASTSCAVDPSASISPGRWVTPRTTRP